MARRIANIRLDEQAPVEAPRQQTREEYEAIIEIYKIQNPRKYEMKKEAFEARLATLPSSKRNESTE